MWYLINKQTKALLDNFVVQGGGKDKIFLFATGEGKIMVNILFGKKRKSTHESS